jgi:endonuclease/exonuclease/phosphatase family metal-dependent hydrolase
LRLRIMSYNIHRAIGVDRRFRPDRILRVVDHHRPDVLLLQEVDDGVPRSRELNLAHELAMHLGYQHYAVGHNVQLRRGRYGNATLSLFPIRRERNIDLTIDGRKKRGCQHVTLEIEVGRGAAYPLEIFNLHLGLSARERLRQVRLLASAPEFAKLNGTEACLVAGDFNDWRSALEPLMREIFGCRMATNGGRPRGPIRTYPAFSPSAGLDRVYYRGAVQLVAAQACRLRVSRVASDHLPIVADFDL